MSPATIAWLHRLAVLAHIAGVVVWMGAVAYYLFILRPAIKAASLERPTYYALVKAIKPRLQRAVGASIVVIVATGLFNAHLRGLLGPAAGGGDLRHRLFYWKMGIVTVLVLTFLTALPLLARVRTPKLRGRLFVGVHWMVLTLGLLAAAVGVFLAR